MADNVMTLVGTLTRDPELKYTAGGQALCNMSVAQNQRYQDKKTKEWVDGEASFFDVTCWAQLAENVSASLLKGMRVMVTGRMQMRRWEDKEGNKRTNWSLVADDVAPSLKWATTTIDQTVREQATRYTEPGDAASDSGGQTYPEEPF